MSFVSNLCSDRALRFQAKHEKVERKAARPVIALDAFQGVHVGEKIVREHGASLERARGDMEALAERADGMDGHRAKQAGRALEAFYSKVGAMLSATPLAERGNGAEAAVREARALVELIKHDELVAPAIAAMTDLLGWAKEAPNAAAAAKTAVASLLERIEGRTGGTSALNVYPNIVWHLEHNLPLKDAAQRYARWSTVAELVADALPRTKFDQVDVTNLSMFVTEELEKNPKNGALDRAKARAFAAMDPSYAGARAKAANLQGAMPQAVLAAIEANRAGPATIAAAFEALLDVTQRYVPNGGWDQIAALLQTAATTPSIEALATLLAAKAPHLMGNGVAINELANAAADPAGSLLRACGILSGLGVNAAPLAELPRNAQLAVAIAVSQRLAPGQDPTPLIWAACEFAKRSPVAGLPVLEAFMNRFVTILPQLRQWVGDEKGLPAAYAVARANLAEPLAADRAQQIAQLCRQIVQTSPDAPLADLIADDAEKRAGLITLSKVDGLRWNPPSWYLTQMLQQLAPVQAPPAAKLALMRHAMQVSNEIAKLDRDPNTIWNHVLQNWRNAIGQPMALKFAMKAGNAIDVRANVVNGAAGDNAAVRFLRAHAEIPAELAFTAGMRLTPEQLGWTKGFLASERSRMMIRNVRDAIFAALDGGRVDLLDAFQATRISRGVIAKIITMVASDYRGGRLGDIPWDALIAGLRKNEDPLPAIERARLGGPAGAQAQPGAVDAIAVMDLMGMGNVKADPETIASMKRALPDLQALLGGLPVGQQVQGAPSEMYRNPILACLQSMVDGTWPAIKYENEAGVRALQGLTPEQKALWMDEQVTPKDGVAQPIAKPVVAAKNDPAIGDAILIMKGLVKALPQEAKLAAPGMPELKFDQASAELLRGELEKVRNELHGAQKGTEQHRALSVKAGPLAACLAVIELQLALVETFAKPNADPAKTLLELEDKLAAAESAARKLGARGCSDAITRVLQAAPEPPPAVKRSPRHGIYAADEDNLEAWVTSFDAGCIASKNGGNRMSQAELISGAQYRMLRVCNETNGILRSMYRLHKVQMPNYQGHAIYMDSPMVVNRGQNATPEMYVLAFEHGLKKAMAMGVPFMFNAAQGNQAAQKLGLAAQNMQVTVSVDRGNTGLHHAQGMQGMPYFVAWPAAQGCGYRNATDDKNSWEQACNFQVVMPPK